MADGRRLVPLLVLGLSVAVLAACSDDGGGDGAASGTTAAVGTPTVPDIPDPSPPGSGVVVVGATASRIAVTRCVLEPDASAPEGARALLVAAGEGTTASGVRFTIEVQRFATGVGDAVTFTDTVAYTDSARILQAQRIEVGGQVTDLRDPDATSALLRPRADGVGGAGLAGAPGDDADDEGRIGIALDLTCP